MDRKSTIDRPTVDPVRNERLIKANQRLLQMMSSGMSVADMARLLNADDLLELEVQGKKTAYSFDARAFLADIGSGKRHITLPEKMAHTNDVLVPSDTNNGIIRTGEGKELHLGEVIPRTRYLTELLTDMEVEYQLLHGGIDENMMRKLPYNAFFIPELGKLVLVCDQTDNATYIVHAVPEGETWKDSTKKKKSQLHGEIDQGRASIVRWNSDVDIWKNQVLDRLVDNQEPAVQLEETKKKTEYETATAEWVWLKKDTEMTVEGNGRIMTVKMARLSRVLTELKKKYPEKFKRMYPLDAVYRKPRNHVHVSIIEMVQAELDKYPPKPDGWETIYNLKVVTTSHYTTIRKIIAPYRKSHPEWFKKYMMSTGNIREHLSPELVEIVLDSRSEYPDREEGWYTISSLETEVIRRHKDVFRAELDAAIDLYPDDKKVMYDQLRRPAIHYGPKIVEYVRTKIQNRNESPRGWRTIPSLAVDYDTPEIVVQELLQQFIATNPGDVGEYEDKSDGIIRKTYSLRAQRWLQDRLQID